MPVLVMGVDGCKKGWVGVTYDGTGIGQCLFAGTLDQLADNAGNLTAIGIDMPIGLPEHGRRPADEQARKLVGRRASSVFYAPPRAVLEIEDYAAANAEATRRGELGISRQVFALRTRIFEVQQWLPRAPAAVWEVHPEVSFAEANDHVTLSHPKSTWAGAHERLAILARIGLRMDTALAPGGENAGVDDVLDATIAAWSAFRLARTEGRSIPDNPPVDATGRPVAIWV